MPRLNLLLSITLAILLSSCGFKLRGDYQIPEQFKQVHVASRQAHAPMQRALKNRLSSFDIVVIDDPVKAQQNKAPVIVLQPERLERQLLSLFATGQVAEYELIYTFREYIDDPDAVLAKSRELDLIVGEMRTQAADRVIRQLATLEALVN
jgi:LPS-assembly lipoprotein